MVTFEKKPTPRDMAINRLVEQVIDKQLELRVYKVTLAVIALSAFTQIMGRA